jgi:DNA repair exonuclease SbcCD nuclease subunit
MFEIENKQTKEFFNGDGVYIGFFSDLHLNPRDSHGKMQGRVSERYKDKLKILSNIVEFFSDLPLNFVVNGGDTFNHPNVGETCKADYLSILSQSKRTVYTLIGNHDASVFSHALLSPQVVTDGTNAKIQIVSATKGIKIGNIMIGLLPYTLDVNGLFEKNNLNADIVFLHNEIKGRHPDGFPLSSFSQIPVEDLEVKKNTTWIFGHYHSPKNIAGNIRFAGACARNGFGDDWKPCISIFKVDAGTKKVSSLRLNINDREFKTFEVSTADSALAVNSEDIVKVKLKGSRESVDTWYPSIKAYLEYVFYSIILKEYTTLEISNKTKSIEGSQQLAEVLNQTVKDSDIPKDLHETADLVVAALMDYNGHDEFVEAVKRESIE